MLGAAAGAPRQLRLGRVPDMTIRQFLGIVELRTKIVSLAGLVTGSLVALRLAGPGGQGIAWPALGLMWAASLAVDMGTTAFNSFFGYWDGSDSRRFNRERDKVLVHAAVAPASALLAALVLYLLAGGLGILLCLRIGWWLLPVGMACMLVGFAYNGGPLPIARTPFGELFAGGFLGWVLPVLTALVALGAQPGRTVPGCAGWLGPLPLPGDRLALAALPGFLSVAAILAVNNSCDAQGDRLAGRRTLAILIGPRAARWLIPALGLLAWLAAAANCLGGLLSPWCLAILLGGLALSLPGWRALDRRGYSHAAKGPAMGGISRLFGIFSLSVALSLILSLAL
jgi:1,4-dihydroxy-2-naphthoate octaprenyltransferase